MIDKRSAFYAFILILVFYACNQDTKKPLPSIDELRALQKSAEEKTAEGDVVTWGDGDVAPLQGGKGKMLYSDNFENLNNWHHEGIGVLDQPEENLLQLNCIGAKQGAAGCMAFCRQDFPDEIVIEYGLKVLSTNGLVINFIAFQGRNGEDMMSLTPREGVFADYVYNPELRGYHVSVSRYGDEGHHTGVSNWRRNPGLFLMAQQEDLCKEPQNWYQIRIIKKEGILQMWVNGKFAGGFKDLDQISEPIPGEGKIGFRAIGKNVVAQIRDFKVYKIK